MSDSILTALVASRDELAQFIVRLDQKEIEIRNDLDTVLGERARRQALLTDLEHVICTHDPDQANQVEWVHVERPVVAAEALNDQFALANPVVPADVPPQPVETVGADGPDSAGIVDVDDFTVARVAREAFERGESMPEAVAKLTGRTKNSATVLMCRLRAKGYDIPRTKAGGVQPPKTVPTPVTARAASGEALDAPKVKPRSLDYTPIAEWINRAIADGTYTVPALAAAFGVTEVAAKNYLPRCRQLGLVDPTSRPRRGRPVDGTDLLNPTPTVTPLPVFASSAPVVRVSPPTPPIAASLVAPGVTLGQVAAAVNDNPSIAPLDAIARLAPRRSEQEVKRWLLRAKNAGLINPPPPAALKVIEDNTLPTVVDACDATREHLQIVAETYKEAVTVGRKPIQTIVDRFDCTREVAQQWVDQARAAGVLPPRHEPAVPAGDIPHHFVPRG